jgi:hypothetical protein
VDGKGMIVKDGIAQAYDNADQPVYSPDSKSFAYIAIMNGKYMIIKD